MSYKANKIQERGARMNIIFHRVNSIEIVRDYQEGPPHTHVLKLFITNRKDRRHEIILFSDEVLELEVPE
jgi:hypothetical protein